MKNIGEYIVNRKQVCKIVDIKTIKEVLYYQLEPVEDASLKLVVPVSSNLLRDTITKEEINVLLSKMPSIEVIQNNEKMIENEYKELMSRGTHEDLVKVIKTAYKRNQERLDQNKKISDRDNEYFNQAEKYLYNELSVVLNLTFDETREYIISTLQSQTI